MSKIFPIDANPTTWHNYSNYLNWVYEKIVGWESSYKLFTPEFRIMNEQLYGINVFNLQTEPIGDDEDNTIIPDAAWVCSIMDGDKLYATEYCFFPSELSFRQSYLNTYYRAWLCYFAPPNAYNDSLTSRTFSMSKADWDKKIEQGEIQQFKPSRLVISQAYAHSGVNFSGNSELLNPEKYLIISKPSAAWYFPTFFEGGVSFNYVKNALEDGGSFVSLTFELLPSRYILAEREKNDSIWGEGVSQWGATRSGVSWSAGRWGSPGDIDPEVIDLYTPNKQLWTNSYPIMHTLQLRVTSATNSQAPSDKDLRNNYYCEDFITDDVFSSQKYNSQSHATAKYSITTPHDEKNITSMWDTIFVVVC